MDDQLAIDDIVAAIRALDTGITDDSNWGERALFYNPGRARKKGIYLATFKLRDGANDSASRLGDGTGRYRFNIGLEPKAYQARFGPRPPRPPAGGVVETGHDFSVDGELMPHPVYAWMGWAAVVNPRRPMLPELVDLAARALERAKQKIRP